MANTEVEERRGVALILKELSKIHDENTSHSSNSSNSSSNRSVSSVSCSSSTDGTDDPSTFVTSRNNKKVTQTRTVNSESIRDLCLPSPSSSLLTSLDHPSFYFPTPQSSPLWMNIYYHSQLYHNNNKNFLIPAHHHVVTTDTSTAVTTSASLMSMRTAPNNTNAIANTKNANNYNKMGLILPSSASDNISVVSNNSSVVSTSSISSTSTGAVDTPIVSTEKNYTINSRKRKAHQDLLSTNTPVTQQQQQELRDTHQTNTNNNKKQKMKKEKICRMNDCLNPAAKRTPYCTKHTGARKCEFKGGCTKCAQGRTRFCISHGGMFCKMM